jgi:hypothetical protein
MTACDAPSAPTSNPQETEMSDGLTSSQAQPEPGSVELGVAYPFDLYTHCGIEHASFAGREWTAARPLPEFKRLPNADGLVEYTGYTKGTMTVVDESTLWFLVTDPYSSGEGQSIEFTPLPPTAQPPPPCA